MRRLIFFAVLTLSACSSGSNDPQSSFAQTRFVVENPDPQTSSQRNILISLQPLQKNGIVNVLNVEFSFSSVAPRSFERLVFAKQDQASLAKALAAGPNAQKADIRKYASSIARQTYCRTGPIGLNKKGRTFSSPSDLQKIINASGGDLLNATLPAGAKGKPTPPIRYSTFGSTGWIASLSCSAPYPY